MEGKDQIKRTVGIFTTFMDFNPGHSLSGIVVDQIKMLLKYNHKVVLLVNEQYNHNYDEDAGLEEILEDTDDDEFKIIRGTKFMHLTDYKTQGDISIEHKQGSIEAGEKYISIIKEEGIERIITHDFIFTGWSLPYAMAVKEVTSMLGGDSEVMWFHWIHSVPSTQNDWWYLSRYGENHYIVFPNQTERQRVAEQFRTGVERVFTIPHIKDIRTWYGFSEDTMSFIEEYPNIMQAGFVQVYPASTDRLHAKQVDTVLGIFGYLKEAKAERVFLVIANQHATGRYPKQNVKNFIKIGEAAGLVYGEDFCFTSEFSTLAGEDREQLLGLLGSSGENDESYDIIDDLGFDYDPEKDDLREVIEEIRDEYRPFKDGITKRMLRELQLIANIFIFPTVEESFGLVGPEASLAGNLVITNKSLKMMEEVMGYVCPTFHFGSHEQIHDIAKDNAYLKAVAHAVLHRLLISESIMTKMRCRIRYNMDSIYAKRYLPFILV